MSAFRARWAPQIKCPEPAAAMESRAHPPKSERGGEPTVRYVAEQFSILHSATAHQTSIGNRLLA